MLTPPFYPSPSAIDLWLTCNARALGKYVAGVKEPMGKAALEGQRLHKLTQEFLVSGRLPPPHERAVHKIVGALPVPGGSIHPVDIERVLVMPVFHGFMDWSDGFGRQGDLKFTSSPQHQRSKDPVKDPQRILYAKDEFYRDPYLLSLRQTWSVAQFNGAAAYRLDHTWTRSALKKAYEKNLARAVDNFVSAVHNKQDWNEAAKDYSKCDMYRPHGCPMKAHGCKRGSLNQRLVAIQPKASALASLTRKKRTQAQ